MPTRVIEPPSRPASRATFVLSQVQVFTQMMRGEIYGDRGLEMLEEFANNIEPRAHTLSREMTADIGGNEMELTSHANHMRSVGAYTVLLRDGYIPAIKIDRENEQLRLQALTCMAYLRAQLEAMKMGLR